MLFINMETFVINFFPTKKIVINMIIMVIMMNESMNQRDWGWFEIQLKINIKKKKQLSTMKITLYKNKVHE